MKWILTYVYCTPSRPSLGSSLSPITMDILPNGASLSLQGAQTVPRVVAVVAAYGCLIE